MAATTLGWNKHGQPHSVAAAAAAAAATADVIGHIYFILYYHIQVLLRSYTSTEVIRILGRH